MGYYIYTDPISEDRLRGYWFEEPQIYIGLDAGSVSGYFLWDNAGFSVTYFETVSGEPYALSPSGFPAECSGSPFNLYVSNSNTPKEDYENEVEGADYQEFIQDDIAPTLEGVTYTTTTDGYIEELSGVPYMSGVITITADNPLDVGPSGVPTPWKVVFLVDMTVIGSVETSPYTLNLDTRDFNNGEHIITTIVYDNANNTVTSSDNVLFTNLLNKIEDEGIPREGIS